MEQITKSLIFAFILLFLMYLFGTIMYHNLEKWSWVDSIYFMTATFTTVGYGDLVPETDAGKIFTVFFMWTGISIGFYLIYAISRYREEKLDTRFIPFLSHLVGDDKKQGIPESARGPAEYGLRQMINPARPLFPPPRAPVRPKRRYKRKR